MGLAYSVLTQAILDEEYNWLLVVNSNEIKVVF